MFKKGDTLIEVVLAIGVFSMVAIAVVAVISGSSAGAQTTLETTLARQEIDSQAEALRFIQLSANAEKNSANNRYYELWKKIKEYSANLTNKSKEEQEKILQYAPTTCDEAYKFGTGYTPFVINTKLLGNYGAGEGNINDVLVPYTDSSGKLTTTTTYPRLTFIGVDENALLDDGLSHELRQAEGIYVIGVEDPNSTQLVSGSDSSLYGRGAAYYDFYIRTCWYGIDANEASTISTVVRLHNPDVIDSSLDDESEEIKNEIENTISFYGNGGYFVGEDGVTLSANRRKKCPFEVCEFVDSNPTRDDGMFLGWSTNKNAVAAMPELTNGMKFEPRKVGYEFYAVWKLYPIITYDGNGGEFWQTETSSTPKISEMCKSFTSCNFSNSLPTLTRSGYEFLGWSTDKNATASDGRYGPGKSFNPDEATSFYAVWREHNETINVTLTWSISTDYDSHVEGQKSDGSTFHAYYGQKIGSDTSGLTIAQLDQDCTGSCTTENFVINTLGGRNYYYYVYDYSNNHGLNGARVTVSGPYIGTQTFTAPSGSGRYWNVFAYKNGKIIPRNTRTSVQDTSY